MTEHTLLLPQLRAEFTHTRTDPQLLLAAGGRAPAASWLRQAAEGRPLWCIDHGLDICWQNQLLPQRLIGDGDSASPEAWQWAEKLSLPIHRFPPAKDFTDTQLGLQLAEQYVPDSFFLLTGAFGGRFDHAFSTILSAAAAPLSGCLCDEQECLFFLKEKENLSLSLARLPKAVSLLPLTAQCSGVAIDGVRWPLQNALLQQLQPYAVSNEMLDKHSMKVANATGILGVYLCWNDL